EADLGAVVAGVAIALLAAVDGRIAALLPVRPAAVVIPVPIPMVVSGAVVIPVAPVPAVAIAAVAISTVTISAIAIALPAAPVASAGSPAHFRAGAVGLTAAVALAGAGAAPLWRHDDDLAAGLVSALLILT